MLEITASGEWPETAINDIIKAREKLLEWDKDIEKIILVGYKERLNRLDAMYYQSGETYKTILIKNGLIDKVINLKGYESILEYYDIDDSFVMLYGYITSFKNFPDVIVQIIPVKIKGVTYVRWGEKIDSKCPKCGKEEKSLPVYRDVFGNRYKHIRCECGEDYPLPLD